MDNKFSSKWIFENMTLSCCIRGEDLNIMLQTFLPAITAPWLPPSPATPPGSWTSATLRTMIISSPPPRITRSRSGTWRPSSVSTPSPTTPIKSGASRTTRRVTRSSPCPKTKTFSSTISQCEKLNLKLRVQIDLIHEIIIFWARKNDCLILILSFSAWKEFSFGSKHFPLQQRELIVGWKMEGVE